mgnify:FL=1
MAMKLEFNSIKNQSIFQPEFQSFSVNGYNVIEFKKQPQAAGGIAVVYAPNGTGKSSLTAVLGNEKTREDLSFEAIYNGNQVIQPETKAFHTIGDQISRNVIEGETSDYLIGQDIKREYVLKKKIADGFETAFNELNSEYKNAYKTTKVSDYLLSVMHDRNPEAYTFVRDIVNKQSKGKNIDRSLFLTYVRDVQKQPRLVDINREKREFVINNVKIVECLLQIDLAQIVANADVQEIEQNDDAINILGKYKHLHSCIVCDNDHIDGDSLLQRKQERRKRIYDSLDVKTKALLKDVAMDSKLGVSDPFEIKNTVLAFISYGELEPITSLREAILSCVNEIVDEMIVALFNVFIPTSMYSWWDEYSTLLEAQPTLDSEELLYIQEIISENIGRNIRITRDDDSDHNFKLMLDDQALLGLDRSEMHLSSGEQNFISLAFALLLARHSRQEFIVLDDPISSFDSVYKNKIVFCIIKFLENKKQIILTHNTDLIRLLNVQLKDCFNLYILNNVDGGRNGFLPVKKDERNILISLSDLVKLFQNKNGTLESIIHDKRLFLMAMIPFLRGYIHIMNDPEDLYGQLSRLMHGFENGSLDIADVYKKTFGYEVEPTEIISVSDILNAPVAGLDIIDAEEYPLLADTLIQTLIYYHTRMKVESELVNIFNIPHTEGQVLLLADIIQKAFRPAVGATQEQKDKARNNRVFFTSRKTLLNEFNHFEGNMNIFQPAIDITEAALQKEVADIESKLMQLRAEMR